MIRWWHISIMSLMLAGAVMFGYGVKMERVEVDNLWAEHRLEKVDIVRAWFEIVIDGHRRGQAIKDEVYYRGYRL